MLSPDEKLDRIRRLFGGEFGDPYDGFVLSGSASSGPGVMRGVFALYEESDLSDVNYWTMRSMWPLATEEAVQILRVCTLHPQQVNAPVVIVEGASDVVNSVEEAMMLQALSAAQAAVAQHGLPAAFVTILRVISDGSQKVVFWYPKGVPLSDRIFLVLKVAVEGKYA